ncbi:hypothetical protein [Klebsiella michiganensis]|uniref:hypothetical protein n=1 Tax=Klebsiella michiganensis TaxID=1134687 RepID=UPI0015EAEBD3|nr:hypothetical protein [Klebsiella michiganensis]QLS18861.1 hypothetical protein HV324_06500 [Klebsiella michiganensis]
MKVKCIKDTEGYWTEGEMYQAERMPISGWIFVGDDDEPDGDGWSAALMEERDDGSILYQICGIDGEVLFEERAA